MTRVNIYVRRRGKGRASAWFVEVGELALPQPQRASAVRLAKSLAADHAAGGGTAEVVEMRLDGTIGPRSTYPRSSDPRRSKG